MCRPLSELDQVYRALKNRPVSERLKYCITLIDLTEAYLQGIGRRRTPYITRHSNEIIRSAQEEIVVLSREKLKVNQH